MEKAPDGTGLPVEAWDRDFKTKLASGTLQAIDNQVDPGSGTIRLRALFTNEGNNLFPNQFVNARLLVDTLKSVVLAPTAAVQRSPTSTFVYVVKADQTVEMRTVTVGPTEGADTEIQTGLNPGEMVVTDGVDKLINGSPVTPRGPGGKGGKGATTRASTTRPGKGATTEPSLASPAGRRHGAHACALGWRGAPTTVPADGEAPAHSQTDSVPSGAKGNE